MDLTSPVSSAYYSPVVVAPLEEEATSRSQEYAERCLDRALQPDEQARWLEFVAHLSALIKEGRFVVDPEDISNKQLHKSMQKIVGKIHLGSRDYPLSIGDEDDVSMTIISLCPMQFITNRNIMHVNVGVEESEAGFGQFVQEFLPTVRQALVQAVVNDRKVLVHCRAGQSRSPAVLALWFAEVTGLPYDDGLHYIQSVRPQVLPAYDRCPLDFGPNQAGKPNFSGLARQFLEKV